jgi:ATP-dependent DNA helicase RecG
MPGPLDVLRNVLELEKRKDFNDTSVSGGLANFTSFLEKPEVTASIPQRNIEAIKAFFLSYDGLAHEARRKAISQLLDWLTDNPGKELEIPSSLKKTSLGPPTALEERAANQKQDAALYASVRSIRGIGDRNITIFRKMGIERIIDLLRYFPRRYQDFSSLKTIDQVQYGDELSVIGSISQDVFVRDSRSGKLKIVETAISDGTGTLRLNWFNKPFLRNQLHKGMPVVVSGKVDTYLGRLVMSSPEWEPLESDQLHTNRIVPIYPLTAGISQRQLRNLIGHNLGIWVKRMKEYFNESLLKEEDLPSIQESIRQIHFPDSTEKLNRSRKRFAFEEIFFLQLGVLVQKRNWVEVTAKSFDIPREAFQKIDDSLPYELTSAQKRAIDEIFEDLKCGRPMNRLLQGDVGAGKTIVARYAMEAMIHNHAQAAVMAPTSILAEQHYKTLSSLLAASGSLKPTEIALLIGDTPAKDREIILEGLSSGMIKVIIGTHALLEGPVIFHDLQLAVIDEQHRFGVEQRKALREKGDSLHLLVMTATPIPRSLAMTVYGDLDVSVIDEMPAGRKPIKTILHHPDEREKAYGLIREQIQRGFQAFIIYPMVELEDEGEDFAAAVNEHKRLSKKVFPDLKVGLIHGQMRPSDKDSIMQQFRAGEFDIMVSTTVIEVGVDIPNATIVLIEGANHFGLAQLHQIRGRVGRNSEDSYCLLIPDKEDGLENERLSAMVRTNDGFELADVDLKLRGPGEFLGTRQSGYLAMRFANLTDLETIERCRKYVKQIFDEDPTLQKGSNELLGEELLTRWPEINLN